MTGIYKFVGIKHIEGEKDGKKYSFNTGCFVGDMSEADVNRGAKGQDVIVPSIPEEFSKVLNESNLGKDVQLTTYYANKRINIAHAELIKK